jgi:hypothetical protein
MTFCLDLGIKPDTLSSILKQAWKLFESFILKDGCYGADGENFN